LESYLKVFSLRPWQDIPSNLMNFKNLKFEELSKLLNLDICLLQQLLYCLDHSGGAPRLGD